MLLSQYHNSSPPPPPTACLRSFNLQCSTPWRRCSHEVCQGTAPTSLWYSSHEINKDTTPEATQQSRKLWPGAPLAVSINFESSSRACVLFFLPLERQNNYNLG